MKKLYSAPSLELLAYCSDLAIGAAPDDMENPTESMPWNNGELGWT